MTGEASFPDFSLTRLLRSIFAPKAGEKICILFDFPKPAVSLNQLAFLKEDGHPVQKLGYEKFYQGPVVKLGPLARIKVFFKPRP